MTLAAAATTASAQSSAAVTRVAPVSASADAASSPVKHKWAEKLKSHKPAAPAVLQCE